MSRKRLPVWNCFLEQCFQKTCRQSEYVESSKKIYIFSNCLVSSKLNFALPMLLEYATYPLARRGYGDLGSFPSAISCQRFPFAGSVLSRQVLRALCLTHLYLEKCMVHRFHRMLVIACSWASSRSALQVF